MKIIGCLLVLMAAVCAGKKIQVKNCNKNTMITIDSVSDEKNSGPIDANSVLNVKYTTKEETKDNGDFDVTFNFKVKKYVFFTYISIPQLTLDGVGKAISQLQDKVHSSKSNVCVDYMYRIIYGSKVRCMPPEGTLTERIQLKPVMNQVRKHLGAKGASIFNGYLNIHVTGKTSFGKDALCADLEFKIQF